MIKDIIEQNEKVVPGGRELEVLKENFPACFSADGTFDLGRFKEYLNTKVAVKNEGYELRFLGKNYARLLASEDTTTVIVPDEEHNAKPENRDSKNIYISGDNLDGLKHLLKSYAHKVKCIYIDPPYNTGSDDFVYRDNFNFTVEELSTRLSIDEEQAQRILDFTKRGSASHSAWLMFMYPRLLLARDLLSDDGVIFISIDDNEQSNLKLLCDDVFGEENCLMVFCRKGYGGKQDSSYFAKQHEYIVCYARKNFVAGEEAKDSAEYKCYDKNKKRKYNRMLLRKWGDAALRSDRPNMFYPLYYDGSKISLESIPHAIAVYPHLSDNSEGRWRLGKDTMALAIEKGLIEIVKNNENDYIAYERIYEPADGELDTKLYSSWIDSIDNGTGKSLLKTLFGGISPFEYPKPLDLIKRILSMGNVQDSIVLDFFSGSATTAHAVMDLNQQDGDHRTFIQIQWPELCKENSEAYKAGFRTVDEIGRKRIELAAQKIREENPLFHGDLGFKHYTLKEPTMQTIDQLEEFNPETDGLFDNSLVAEFGKPTVLETWLVHDGHGFGAPVQEIEFANYKAYWCGKYLYLLDFGLTTEGIKALIEKLETDGKFNPEHIVLFGYSFAWGQLETLKVNLSRVEASKQLKINLDVRY